MKSIDHVLRPLCLVKADKIARHCGRFMKGRTLDFGAGRCYIARELKNKYKTKITCVDIADLNETELKLDIYNGKTLPYKANSFDTVLIVYVLHHCSDPIETLKECRRVCKNGGRLVIFEDFGMIFYMHAMDWLSNKIHNVDAPLNFKTRAGWLKVFGQLGFDLEYAENGVEKQIFYPFVRHTMFVLKVNK
jgi:SAM-dependent methyltransferase